MGVLALLQAMVVLVLVLRMTVPARVFIRSRGPLRCNTTGVLSLRQAMVVLFGLLLLFQDNHMVEQLRSRGMFTISSSSRVCPSTVTGRITTSC